MKKDLLLSNGKSYPTYFRPALGLDVSSIRYTGFKQEKIILKKGSVRREGALPLSCDIILERDVAVKMRDGTTIYTDIFRPVENGNYPALIVWSPYGKEFGGQYLDDVPHRAGVPFASTSNLEKFEGPDPAYWIQHGYAIINPDIRGAFKSEGDILFWSHQSALDGHDLIEWVSKQDWSNSKVGMTGNSWLSISQWLIAAQNPPSLTAIAPWEGASDLYREITHRGGIPTSNFVNAITQTFASENGQIEDMGKMILENTLMDDYWKDKAFNLENIKIPAYIVASYTNPIHTFGTFEGYRRISSKEKWLRIHNTHEWSDYYAPENVDDLRKFFDYYLKGSKNNWEDTPNVRLSLFNSRGADIVNRPEICFPLEGTKYQKLYLDAATNSLSHSLKEQSVINYNSEIKNDSIEFDFHFNEDVEIVGYMKLKLWVESIGNNDMDLAISVKKLSVNGDEQVTPYGLIEAKGQLRVSLRELNLQQSKEEIPIHSFINPQFLKDGQIVPVEISIWPIALLCYKGEVLKLTIKAYNEEPMLVPPSGSGIIDIPVDVFTFMPGESVKMRAIGGNSEPYPYEEYISTTLNPHNKGLHQIHTGEKYDSYLYVPFIPIK